MSDQRRLAVVTGGLGFIGSHLAERLVADGWHVRIADNRPAANWQPASIATGTVEVVECDIRDASAVATAAISADVIFHQAAVASVQRSIEHPRETVEVNIGGTLNVLEAARQQSVRRVVFASSAAVYGDGPESPKTETLPPRPLSPYAVSKLTGEHLCQVYAHLHGLQTVSLRYFNVFGPRQDPSSPYSGVISRFTDAIQRGAAVTIFGDGEQTRDFVYVGDVVRANLLAATAPHANGRAFNIGSGRATSLNTLLAVLSDIVGAGVIADYQPARPGDIRASVADISAARSALGFSVEHDLSRALRSIIPGIST